MKCTNCGRNVRKKNTDAHTYWKMYYDTTYSRTGKGMLKQTNMTRRCPFCVKNNKK